MIRAVGDRAVRYHSELAPLVLGAATRLETACLHTRFPEWAPLIDPLVLTVSPALG
ncbi:MAG: hypothetical protein ACRDR6_29995 [Pseudonocardiaceae bacterium]